jgi:SAM-dependent methyltransferase
MAPQLANQKKRHGSEMKKLLLLVALLVGVFLTIPLWKPIAKKSKWFIIATNMYQDVLRRTHLKADQIGGEPQAGFDPTQLQLIDNTFNRYLKYSGLTRETLKDKTVLEIGPGEYIGVALKFLAAGAREVVCLDKFVHFQNSPAHLRLYQELRKTLTAEDRERFDRVINLENGIKLDTNRLKWIYGKGVEETDSLFPPAYFDVIVSAAVLEEIYNTDLAFQKMDRLLNHGGYTIHKIDVRDYGMFSKHGFHPLEFLTVPDSVYRYMSEATGQPNRQLANYYRDKMRELGYESKIYVAIVAGQKEMPEYKTVVQEGVDYSTDRLKSYQAMRPHLLDRYQSVSDEDLITEALLLVGKKP